MLSITIRVFAAICFLVGNSFCVSLSVVQGKEIAPYLDSMRSLNDTAQPDLLLLRQFVDAPEGLLIRLHDEEKLIGYALGIPMVDFYIQPITPERSDVNSIYYVHEVTVLKEYQGKGYEQLLYRQIEQRVRSAGSYALIAVSCIEGYQPNRWLSDAGFVHYPDLVSYFAEYSASTGKEVPRKVTYWLKGLTLFSRQRFYLKFIKKFVYYYLWAHI